MRTVRLPAPGSAMDRETLDYVVIGDLPTLVWAANLAAIELHVPQWTVGPRGGVREPDRLVLDLDPGEPATAVQCAEVALLLRELVEADGLTAVAKSSGSKGLQVYAAVSRSATGVPRITPSRWPSGWRSLTPSWSSPRCART